MELTNASMNSAYALHQAVTLAMLQKTMGLSADVVSTLLPEAQAVSAKTLELSVNPHIGSNVDVLA